MSQPRILLIGGDLIHRLKNEADVADMIHQMPYLQHFTLNGVLRGTTANLAQIMMRPPRKHFGYKSHINQLLSRTSDYDYIFMCIGEAEAESDVPHDVSMANIQRINEHLKQWKKMVYWISAPNMNEKVDAFNTALQELLPSQFIYLGNDKEYPLLKYYGEETGYVYFNAAGRRLFLSDMNQLIKHLT